MAHAWVTLATNDSYSLGALVLAHSLKQVGTTKQLAVLVTPGVTSSMREKLSLVFNVVQEVNILDSKDEANLRLLKRPELGVTFTKLHCWRLTQFDKCVFLDADTLVLQFCDELFDREELSAAPDVGWPDCFNSGVFVYRPSLETYEKLIQFALDKGSFDGGDQGLLNLYFSDWATKDISKHLPFIYNLCSTACYSYLPAFKQFGENAKIVHFIGASKPWLQYFNTETRHVQPAGDLRHLQAVLQHWWDIFCKLIHPQLTPNMPRSRSDVTHTNQSHSNPSQHYTPPQSPKNEIWDPWEEYDQRQSAPTKHIEPETKPFQSHNTNASHTASSHDDTSYLIPVPEPLPVEPPKDIIRPPEQIVPNVIHNEHVTSQYHNEPVIVAPPELHQITRPPSPKSQAVIENVPPWLPVPPVQPNECEAPTPVCNETTLHEPEDNKDSGLAGAFAQLTLGAPRTAEQSALDDHLRRQGWEVGNIDYLGRDSFDNIWSKICQTLSIAGATPPVVQGPTVPTEEKPEDKTSIQESVDLPKPEGIVASQEQIKTVPSPLPEVTESTSPQAVSQVEIPKSETQTSEPVPKSPEIVAQPQETPTGTAPICPLPSKDLGSPVPPETAATAQSPKATPESAAIESPPVIPQSIKTPPAVAPGSQTVPISEPSPQTPVSPQPISSGPQSPPLTAPTLPTTVPQAVSQAPAGSPQPAIESVASATPQQPSPSTTASSQPSTQPAPASSQSTPTSPSSTPTSVLPAVTSPEVATVPLQPAPVSPQPIATSPQATPTSPPSTPTSAVPAVTTPEVATVPLQPAPVSPQPIATSPQAAPTSPPSTPTSALPAVQTPEVSSTVPVQPAPVSPQPTATSPQATPTSPPSTPTSALPAVTTPEVASTVPLQPAPVSPQPIATSPQPPPESPKEQQIVETSPQPTSESSKSTPSTPEVPQPALTGAKQAPESPKPASETPKAAPQSPQPTESSKAETPEAKKAQVPKSPETESKKLPDAVQEGTSTSSPTPPPRKSGGGGKKASKPKK